VVLEAVATGLTRVVPRHLFVLSASRSARLREVIGRWLAVVNGVAAHCMELWLSRRLSLH